MLTTLALSPTRVVTVTGPQTAAVLAGGALLSFAVGASANRVIMDRAEKKRAEAFLRIPYSEVLQTQHKAEKAAARHARGVAKGYAANLLEELRIEAANAYEAALHARAFCHLQPTPVWTDRPDHTKFTTAYADASIPTPVVAKEGFFARFAKRVKGAVTRTPRDIVTAKEEPAPAPVVVVTASPDPVTEKAVEDLRDLTDKIRDIARSVANVSDEAFIDDPGEASEEDLECAEGVDGNGMHLDPALAAFAAAVSENPDSTGSETVDKVIEAAGSVIDKATQMLSDAVARSEAETPAAPPTAGAPLRTPMITEAARKAAARVSGAPRAARSQRPSPK